MLAVSTTDPPVHIVVDPFAVIVGVGFGATLTVVAFDVPLQPFVLLTTTV